MDLFTGNDDYEYWAADYGLFDPDHGTSNSVPEPTAALLAAIGSFLCGTRRVR